MTLQKFSANIDGACLRLEARFGLTAAAALVGIFWLVLACIYVTPAISPVGFGIEYAQLSQAPLSLSGRVGFRFLSPAIGYLLFLRGSSFVLFPLLMAVAFLAAVYRLSRTNQYSPSEGVAMAGLMAMSAPILFTIRFAGYTDTTTFFCLLLALVCVRHVVLYTLFFALALLNHEQAFFAVFWLLWMSLLVSQGKAIWLRNLLGSAVAIGLMVGVRTLLESTVGSQADALTPLAYLDPAAIWKNTGDVAPYFFLGLFQAFKLLWIIPVLAAWHWFNADRYGRCFFYVIVFASTAVQLMFAHDTMRLMAMAFPAILVGAHDLRGVWGPEKFGARLWFLLAATCVIPQFYVAMTVRPFFPLPYTIMGWVIALIYQ